MLESDLNYSVIDLVSSSCIVLVVDNYSMVTRIGKIARIRSGGVVTKNQRVCLRVRLNTAY